MGMIYDFTLNYLGNCNFIAADCLLSSDFYVVVSTNVFYDCIPCKRNAIDN